jgi:methionyl aminopeptidase
MGRSPMTLKTPEQIGRIRAAGRVVAECHALMREMAKPGVRTRDMDREVEKLIRARGGEPAFLGYPGPTPFPGSICASVNDEVVHGIPNNRRLKDGDLLSVDVGVKLDGFFGDAANTLCVGTPSEEVETLIRVAWEALERGVAKIRPEARLSEVVAAIQEHAEKHGYSLVRQFVGHGIGQEMHEEPQVPNYVSDSLLKNDFRLKAGLCLAIEPMVNTGSYEVRTKKNKWTVVTRDGGLSAHVEHSVAVTEEGHEVLTHPVGDAWRF